MDSVLRAAVVYAVLMVLFRLAGKRTLAEVNTFDVVLLLVISEAVQQALIDGDESMTNAFLLVMTLIGLDVAMSLATRRWRRVDRVINDGPLVILKDGQPYAERMRRARVTLEDVMEQARALQGIEHVDDIKFAVLERGGSITVIPADRPSSGDAS